ncbi:MAG TPA: hypothetical protein VFQ95_04850 [Rhodanobacteraceae bacterium]|nr:hypothetical protein [Rhodanobacteraceae bacterium]
MSLTRELVADPVQFAQWATDNYLAPVYQRAQGSSELAKSDVARWNISQSELALYRCELPLMAAAGVTVTVAKNLWYEYYNSFLNALCGRLVHMLYGHYSEAFVKDARDNIELYIAHLESKVEPGAAGLFIERVFGANPSKAQLLHDEFWKPGMDALLQTLHESRQSLAEILDAASKAGG